MKQKRWLCTLFAAAALLTASGCKADAAVLPLKEAASKAEAALDAPTKEDYEYFYHEPLSRACSILMEPNADIPIADGEMGIQEVAFIGNALDFVGYAIEDISGDGIAELLIGYMDDGTWNLYSSNIFAVYTLKDNAPVLALSGVYRDAYRYLGGGRFLNVGSGGAYLNSFGTFSLSRDGQKLTCEDFYFTVPRKDAAWETTVYSNKTGECNAAKSAKFNGTEDDFWILQENLLSQTGHIAWTRFADYAAEIGYIPKADSPVRARWFHEVLLTDSAYDTFVLDNREYAQEVVLFTTMPLADFKLMRVSLDLPTDENAPMVCTATPLYEKPLTPERPLVLKMAFPGDLPSYAVSCTDEDGTVRRLALWVSGMDGSLSLSEEDWDWR